MKKLFVLLAGVALLGQVRAGIPLQGGDLQMTPVLKGTLTISSTRDLEPLAMKWVSDFKTVQPGIQVRMVDLNAGADLLFTSAGSELELTRPLVWNMAIGRDAIVPITNSYNPLMDQFSRQGVSAQELAGIFQNPGVYNSSDLLEGVLPSQVNAYLITDESITASIAQFTGTGASTLRGIQVGNCEEMVNAIRKDPNGIGFCRLAELTGIGGQELPSGISLLPIDKNANGRLDYIENIYANAADFSRGLWIGKYPAALSRNLKVQAALVPESESEKAFLKYVLTSGQDLVALSGFNALSSSERLSKIDRLPGAVLAASSKEPVNVLQLVITIIAGLMIVIAITGWILHLRRVNKPAGGPAGPSRLRVFNEGVLSVPKGLLFDRSHTWAFMEKDGTVKVGIDDFLQHVTGGITSIRMKKPGERVVKGEPVLALVQNGKRLNIASPVSGIIVADNNNLFHDAGLVNSSPFADGWIYRIEPTNWVRENQFLLMAEKYTEWIRGEFTRLKDFLAHAVEPGKPEMAYAILQDGGEITDHVLENLPPEVWEDFQMRFIEPTK